MATKRDPNAIVRYFRETGAELRRVNWPTRREAANMTVIVLVSVGVTSAILGLLDFLFSRFFAFIISLG
ncbi:MAG: preprotein translocase subunit SecE [Chloroflexi bacterium RBG_13_68_17]|nr:MAG: preprotein translocase subunit SecE [Chloroflexi bacterium RBG_13_68_17]